jgi:O-methyltransferase
LKVLVRKAFNKLLNNVGYELSPVVSAWRGDADIPDAPFYRAVFSPWLGYGDFGELYKEMSRYSLVSRDRCWILYTLARQSLQVPGDLIECGVYRGGTALLLGRIISRSSNASERKLLLFDSFKGMKETNRDEDLHEAGNFSDTSLASVQQRVAWFKGAEFYPGWIPETFHGLEGRRFAFSHIDVDLHQSILDCCSFIYPRLAAGGFMIFDDYGFPSCPGARSAVDAFFKDKPEVPLVLPTGQALVFKSPA